MTTHATIVLVLSAEPAGFPPTYANSEIRAIQNALSGTPYGSAFDSHVFPGAQIGDLAAAILRRRPTILHFIGHGNRRGELVFEGPDGTSVLADPSHITEVFRILRDVVRGVVLSACYSADQAELIAQYIEFVIGVPARLESTAAVSFSQQFYAALVAGRSLQDAFDLAKTHLSLVGMEDPAGPELYVRRDIDANRSYFHIEGLPDAVVARDLLDSANTAITAQADQAAAASEAGAFDFALDERRLAYEHALRVYEAAPSDDTARVVARTEFQFGSALLGHGARKRGIEYLVTLANRFLTGQVPPDEGLTNPLVLSLAQSSHPVLGRKLLHASKVESERLSLILDIAESKLPDALPDDAFLLTQIAFAREREGDFAESARLTSLILTSQEVTMVERVNACLLLGRAIYATAVQSSWASTLIAPEDRFAAILQFSELLADLRDQCIDAKPVMQIALEEIALVVQGCTFDMHGEDESRQRLARLVGEREGSEDAGEAEARDRTDSRVEPWMSEYESFGRLLAEQRNEDADRRIRELVIRYPHIHVFHWQAAQLGPDPERLGFAQRAWELVPGVGQACKLAELLIRAERYREARELLEPLLGRRAHARDVFLLRAAAWSMRKSDPSRADQLFARYFDLEPTPEPSDLLCHADVLQSLSRWKQYDAVVDRVLALELEPASVIAVAQSLLAHANTDADVLKRLREVHQRLGSTPTQDPAIDRCRLEIYFALGSPADLAGPDFTSLVESGLMQAVSTDYLKDHLREWRRQQADIWTAWRNGWIPFASFQRATGLESAQLLHRMMSHRSGKEPVFVPPFMYPNTQPPEIGIESKILLLGDLEIALLLELGVWDVALERLGPEGKLVVFEDLWEEQIRDSATRIRRLAQPVALDRERALLEKLRRRGKVRERSSQRATPVTIIEASPTSDNVASVYDLLEVLTRENWLPRDARYKAMPQGRRRWDSTPPYLSLDYGAIGVLDQANLLAEIVEFDAIKEIIVASEVFDMIERRIDELSEPFAAATRAEAIKVAVLDARASGALELVPRPLATIEAELPPPRRPDWHAVREQTISLLSWRRYLHDEPRALLLSADHATAAGSVRGSVGLSQMLAWTSTQQLLTAWAPYEGMSGRVLSFAEFVEWLAPASRKLEVVEALTRLGLPGAMYSEHILSFAEQFEGLSGPRMQRLFDLYEWLAHSRLDSPASTQNHACAVYAKAVWLAWCSPRGRDLTSGIRDDLCKELCRRIAALAPEEPGLINRRFFYWLLIIAISSQNWNFSVVDSDGQTVEEVPSKASDRTVWIDERSRAAQLWTWLRTWVGASPARVRAWNMAIQYVAMHVETREELPTGVMASILHVAAQLVAPMDPTAMHTAPVRHLVLLSSRVKDARSPLVSTSFALRTATTSRKLSYADALDFLAGHGTRVAPWQVAGSIAVEDETFPISGPPELALLRTAGEDRRRQVEEWAKEMAPFDGQLAKAALELIRREFEPHAIDDFLVAAIRSPWHSKDDDVLGPVAWGAAADIYYPNSLADLESLLLEDPDRYEPFDFVGKTSDGGPYAGLVSNELIRQVTQVPGLVRWQNLAQRGGFRDEEIDWAWQTLESAKFELSTDVAAATVILVVHASTNAEQDDTLADRLSRALAKVLADELEAESDSTTQCAAVLERRLLGRCKDTVVRLVQSSRRSLPPTQVVWLSWRLFQWWWVRLSSTDFAHRRGPLSHLLSLEPEQDLQQAATDVVLDPDRFGVADGWNHRLASVLMAMFLGAELAARDGQRAHPRLLGDVLEPALRTLAERPLTAAELSLRAVKGHSSPLGWFGPVAVPDLALMTMLRLVPGALARTPTPVRAQWYQTYLVDDPATPACSHLVRAALIMAISSDGLDAEAADLDVGPLVGAEPATE